MLNLCYYRETEKKSERCPKPQNCLDGRVWGLWRNGCITLERAGARMLCRFCSLNLDDRPVNGSRAANSDTLKMQFRVRILVLRVGRIRVEENVLVPLPQTSADRERAVGSSACEDGGWT